MNNAKKKSQEELYLSKIEKIEDQIITAQQEILRYQRLLNKFRASVEQLIPPSSAENSSTNSSSSSSPIVTAYHDSTEVLDVGSINNKPEELKGEAPASFKCNK